MPSRILPIHLLVGALLTVAGIVFADPLIAGLVHEAKLENAWIFANGTLALDVVTGKTISKFLISGVILLAGVTMSTVAKTRMTSLRVLYVGSVQLLSTLLAGVGKNLFGRLRPFQLLLADSWDQAWFAGGSSFPSGHTAFYFGLFLPLACLFPRWKWPLLGVPWFIAAARIIANDHFVTDVAASVALVALIAQATLAAFDRTLGPRGVMPTPTRAAISVSQTKA